MNTKRILTEKDSKYFFNTSINTIDDAFGVVDFYTRERKVCFDFTAALLFRFNGVYADKYYDIMDNKIDTILQEKLIELTETNITEKTEFDYIRHTNSFDFHFNIKVEKKSDNHYILYCLCFEKMFETEEQIGLYSDVIGSGLSLFKGCTWWTDYDRQGDHFYQTDNGPEILGIELKKDKLYNIKEFQKVRERARLVSEFFDKTIEFELQAYERVRNNETDYFAGRTPALTNDEKTIWVESYGKCFLRYPDGSPRLFVAIDIYMTDIYEEKTQLELLNNLVDYGLINSDVGVWYHQRHYAEGRYYFTEAYQQLMSTNRLYKDDTISKVLDEQIELMMQDGRGYEKHLHEFRLVHNSIYTKGLDKYHIVIPNYKDKDTFQWIEIRGTVIERDEEGHVLLFVGVNVDVTESTLRNLELERLRIQNERLMLAERLATKARDLLVWYIDEEQDKKYHIFINEAIEQKLGIKRNREGYIRISDVLDTLTPDTDYHQEHELVTKVYNNLNKETIESFPKTICKHINKVTGKEYYFEHSIEFSTHNLSVSGSLVGGLMLDVTESIIAQSQIKFLAEYDTLTGVHNRNYFEGYIRSKLPATYSILIFDVDGLKLINDAFGHLQGDLIIKEVASILQDIFKENLFIARIGGDEFAVLTKDVDFDEVTAKANVLEARCEEFNKTSNIELIISKGGKRVVNNDIDFNKAFVEAENIMYRRKLNNRSSRKSKVLESILETLNAKTEETKEHSERLSVLAVKTMQGLKMSRSSEVEDIRLLCRVHDIGKITIEDNILKKPGKLTNAEFELVKKHCEAGYKIIRNITDSDDVCNGVLFHHERWDGKGYPQGLKGEKIPIFARVINVVDSFDAMTNDRVYGSKISVEEAIEEIKICSGSQFDPTVVKAFLKTCFDIDF